jgi:hypothetical protein
VDKQWTIDEIEAAHRKRGGHFFSVGAVNFFRSRVSTTVFQGEGGVYFITSERVPISAGVCKRSFTVRKFFAATGAIGAADRGLATRSHAASVARKLAYSPVKSMT